MQIQSLNEIGKMKEEGVSFFVYFSSPNCGVCQVLKPKLVSMLADKYPEIKACQVDTAIHPDIAAQLGFYTNPSFIIYLNGQEYIRRSRSISLQELDESLERPYKLMF
jgi:thioredoxin-like negative regulator of GroEL